MTRQPTSAVWILVAALLSQQAAHVAGCFFFESGACDMTQEMCGIDVVVAAESEQNRCAKFIFSVNHADGECFPQYAGEELPDYRECFWDEIHTHVGQRDSCGPVCYDSHNAKPHQQAFCYEHCLHLHTCFTRCSKKRYKYRQGISDCLSDCSLESPASEQEGTCQNSCAGHSANRKCWCDPTCVYTNDCCKDYDNWCRTKSNATIPMINETLPKPAMNVTQQNLAGQKHLRKHAHVDPKELGINETAHPLVAEPPKNFNASNPAASGYAPPSQNSASSDEEGSSPAPAPAAAPPPEPEPEPEPEGGSSDDDELAGSEPTKPPQEEDEDEDDEDASFVMLRSRRAGRPRARRSRSATRRPLLLGFAQRAARR